MTLLSLPSQCWVSVHNYAQSLHGCWRWTPFLMLGWQTLQCFWVSSQTRVLLVDWLVCINIFMRGKNEFSNHEAADRLAFWLSSDMVSFFRPGIFVIHQETIIHRWFNNTCFTDVKYAWLSVPFRGHTIILYEYIIPITLWKTIYVFYASLTLVAMITQVWTQPR